MKPRRAASKPMTKTAKKTGKKTGKKVASKTAQRAAAKTATKSKPAAAAARFRIPGSDRAVVDALDELFGGRPDLRKGAMFGCPGYFVGAKAVACVFGSELNLTLPPDRIAALVQKPGYRLFQPMGRTMTGWVLIDQERLQSLDPQNDLLEAAVAYARSKAEKAASARSRR